MNVYCSGSPSFHHKILDVLIDYKKLNKIVLKRNKDDSNNLKNTRFLDTSLLRLDNHSDDYAYKKEYDCSNYVKALKYNFDNRLWIFRDKESIKLVEYENCFEKKKRRNTAFKDIKSLMMKVNNELKTNTVLDVDPDIVTNYPCKFTTGCMREEHLSSIINSVESNVLFMFFSAPPEFAKRVLDGTEYKISELIKFS